MNNSLKADLAFEQWRRSTVPGFDYVEINGTGVFKIKSFEQSGLVRHCFTSRVGGVSTGCYAGLNMSWTRTEGEGITRRNYEIAAEAIGIDPQDLVVVDGDHGTSVLHVSSEHKGNGLYRPWRIGHKFDAMSTDESGVALCTIHGDCTPVFVLDTRNKAICMCHSGWRGTVDSMPEAAIRRMERYGSNPTDLLVAVGPAIGECCFEVGQDVADLFRVKFPMLDCIRHSEKKGKYNIDLLAVTLWQFYNCGVSAGNVTVADMCTCCDERRFHSFRRDGMSGGSMAGILQLV